MLFFIGCGVWTIVAMLVLIANDFNKLVKFIVQDDDDES